MSDALICFRDESSAVQFDSGPGEGRKGAGADSPQTEPGAATEEARTLPYQRKPLLPAAAASVLVGVRRACRGT